MVQINIDFFSNTTSGKKYDKSTQERSDDPEIRSVLENSEDLLKYLKSTEYEIGRLQGNVTRKILRNGQEITEEQARELLIDSSGKINFPDYEVDLSAGLQR